MRTRPKREAAAWLALTELATAAPFVAAERLQRAGAMPASKAWFEWAAWTAEKAFAWQLVAARCWAASLRGATPGVETALDVLAPVAQRVKRNARRARR